MESSTPISDLPSQISMNVTNKTQEQPQTSTIPNEQLNMIMNTIKNNDTSLPSKDIPMNTIHHTHDEQTKPNFTPQSNNVNYIDDSTYSMNTIQNTNISNIIETIHIPVTISLLYFIFQLPIINNKLYTLIPSLFLKEGQLTSLGMILKSLLFGTSILLVKKLIEK